MTPARVMTVEEVARLLRCHPRTVYGLIKKRKIPAFRVDSSWRFNVEDIERWRFDIQMPLKAVPPVRRGPRRRRP
jgi:excisionase family DNA binding protein